MGHDSPLTVTTSSAQSQFFVEYDTFDDAVKRQRTYASFIVRASFSHASDGCLMWNSYGSLKPLLNEAHEY